MGGPSQAQTQQQNIASQQNQEGLQLEAQAQALQQKGLNEEQPAIDYYSALTSGDRGKALTAAGPTVSNISKQADTAKQQIADSVGPGAARDIATSNVTQGANSQVASALNTQYTSSFDKLANLGAGIGAFSLQDLGAGLNSTQSSASNYGQVTQEQNAQKASTLGFLGSLAGAAGTVGAGFAQSSDIRIKENIFFIRRIADVDIYEYNFIGKRDREIGVIAQEVYRTHPAAVYVGGDDPAINPWRVDYATLKRFVGDFYSGPIYERAA